MYASKWREVDWGRNKGYTNMKCVNVEADPSEKVGRDVDTDACITGGNMCYRQGGLHSSNERG